MAAELVFESARFEDLDRIVEIYNSTIPLRTVTADTEPISVESRKDWFIMHDEKSHPLWIVKKDNSIIGWVSFQKFYGRQAYQHTAEISIYLDEAFRGQGLGKKILSYSISQCSKLNIKTLLGYIFAENLPSIHIFESLGFSEWANLSNIAEIDGKEMSLKILGRRVIP